MKSLRKILVKILGLKGYLKLISRTYIRMMNMGMKKDRYAELHFIPTVIKDGDVIIDIGANLAYYSYFMAKSMGKGKLLSVEPIPLFADIWKTNMKKWSDKDVQLFNCALGNEAKDEVTMSIPVVDGVIRHGLTKVSDDSGGESAEELSFKVPMKVGDKLFEDQLTDRLDYVKCDVEGYEQYVMPSLNQTIDKYLPMIQIELSGEENRTNVVNYLLDKGYEMFILNINALKPIQKNDIFTVDQDFYFIHSTKLDEKSDLIRK